MTGRDTESAAKEVSPKSHPPRKALSALLLCHARRPSGLDLVCFPLARRLPRVRFQNTAIGAAHAPPAHRGARVHPVVLPRDEVTRRLKSRHEELAAEIPATVYLRKEHLPAADLPSMRVACSARSRLPRRRPTLLAVRVKPQRHPVRLAHLAADVATLPVTDGRRSEDIIGYDDAGLPS
jgi:hypothetical protein